MSNAMTWPFIGALLAATATQLWLAKRQIRRVRARRDAVPRMFAEAISLDAHQKAAVTKTQLGMLEIVLGAFALHALTLGGLIDWLGAQWARVFEPQGLAHGVALCANVAVLLAALELPFSIYRDKIEDLHCFLDNKEPTRENSRKLRKALDEFDTLAQRGGDCDGLCGIGGKPDRK